MADNNFNFGYNPETGNYEPITNRNAVGSMKTVNNSAMDNPFEPTFGTHEESAPSQYDFTGATYDPKLGVFKMPDGKVVAYSAGQDMVTNYVPIAPNNIWQNKLGQTVGNYRGNDILFQGHPFGDEQYMSDGGFLVDPKTGQYLKDASGNYLNPTDPGSSGGFSNWMADNGWMLPLAMAGGAVAGAAMGAGAAAGTAGAEAGGAYGSMGGAAGLGGSMGTGLTTGAGATGLTTGAGASGGLLGAGSASGLAATQAAAGLGGSYLTGEAGLSATDALKYANRARSIANLLKNSNAASGGMSSNNGANAYPQTNFGQIKMNQNPFIFTPAGQTLASEGMYDVSGSNLANALRKA